MFGMSPSLAAGVVRVYLHAHPTDMRRSYDGLCAFIESAFQRDVRCGGLFSFLNRRLDRMKLMYWDRDGIAIWIRNKSQTTPILSSLQKPANSPIISLAGLLQLMEWMQAQQSVVQGGVPCHETPTSLLPPAPSEHRAVRYAINSGIC